MLPDECNFIIHIYLRYSPFCSVQDQFKTGEAVPDFILRSVSNQKYSTKELHGNIIVLIMGYQKIRKKDNKQGK